MILYCILFTIPFPFASHAHPRIRSDQYNRRPRASQPARFSPRSTANTDLSSPPFVFPNPLRALTALSGPVHAARVRLSGSCV
ncbi:hypothetical protein GY45DRAFT_693308 [Cubamyces sp. BRFM 1775]|nr:hypothetical protein GY45DRAFT_693308 [Cubamyces sp. BRFM 1775]